MSPKRNWIMDSGATCHVYNDCNSFVELRNLKKTLDITLEDGHTLKAIGHGTVILMMKTGCLTRKCKLHDVLFVPNLTCNLLSVSKAVEKGISVIFNKCVCVIKDAKHRLITVEYKVGSLYHVMYAKPKDHVYAVTELKLPENNEQLSREHLRHRRYALE